MAREPSGTLVEVLCGQPEQNQGVRSLSTCKTVNDCSLASMMARRASMRATVSLSRPSFLTRAAIALAISAGDKSALARSKVLAEGLGMLHSPPPNSVSISLNLPTILGRTSARQL